MKIIATRDSVCMGDDVDAPHQRIFLIDNDSVHSAIREISTSGYLASISGGHATWLATSSAPIAVIAQQWNEPKFLTPDSIDDLDFDGSVLKVRFKYFAQEDPEVVLKGLLSA